MVYKIIAKVLTDKLKVVHPFAISESQSAFVPDKLITDNIMMAYELNHYLKRKRQGKHGSMALKIDMSKVYDRVEWQFLSDMMTSLGFHQLWVRRIMACVTSVSYYVLHNGERLGPIPAEGLSNSLSALEGHELIHWCKVARGAPAISQFFFADDNYTFFRAIPRNVSG